MRYRPLRPRCCQKKFNNRSFSYNKRKQEDTNPDEKFLAEARDFVYSIHVRARNNAFAHREAANDLKRSGDRWTISNLLSTTFALLFTALALVFQEEKATALILTCVSITSSFLALFTQSILIYKRFDTAETLHTYFQQSFQYISQRAREIERPHFETRNISPLIDDLERDFSILKSRANEPQDVHFRRAADLQKEIRTNPKYSGALSFPDLAADEKSNGK